MASPAQLANRRILIVDDNAAIHLDFRKVLGAQAGHSAQAALDILEANLFGETATAAARPNFEIDSAHQGQEGVAMAHQALLEGRPYAMAFVDMRMPPGWDGLKTIERLWATDPDVQVVICSAHTDYDWTEVVQRLGHSDKLLVLRKPAEPIEVLQCATALSRKWENDRLVRDQMLRLEEVITTRTRGLEAANQQLRHLATHDALTGLPNRVLLDDRLLQAIAHAERDMRSFAVLVCDLDRFKLINDSLGHRAGDELLQEVARRLNAVVRTADTVARFGGDEFVLIGTSIADTEDAADLAARVMSVLQAPVRIAGIDIHTSPSIGIAMYPDDGDSVQALLAHADAAMYSAKQNGRGNFRRYEAGMHAGTEDRVQLESDLHTALSQNQFQLYYQPKVDTRTGEVRSAEALIRWVHPTRGVVSPADFIPLAEECGLIGAIGEWVVREACRQARAWQLDGVPPLRISVNLSASQFRDTGLVDNIRRALDDAGLQARYLEVELTESAVMSDPEQSIAILEQLSAMGVLVSVDDFGTGYSSMSYLRRFPIDKLKIDRVFINEIVSRPEDASIVRAIVSLAHSLRLKVVAEGVETSAQLDFLKTANCDEYQGFHFSRPLPAAEFEHLIRESHSQDDLTDDEAARTHSKLSVLVRK
ncbi:MAG TPA: EAL domain-containing protein [Steroidobacteraceae bacterium]|nr:EAL domain-containing protein [Steroidobacteraceae bacterium]